MSTYLSKLIFLITFFSLSFSYSYELLEINLLLEKIKLPINIKKRILQTETIGESLKKKSSKIQLYNSLYRFLTHIDKFPEMSYQTYPDQQSSLLLVAAKILKQDEYFSLSDYKRNDKREYVHFIHDASDGSEEKVVAVFKSGQPRLKEILTWEIASIFGIEKAFTPAIPLTLDGQIGELQLYRHSDLNLSQIYDTRIYGFVTFESYINCALGVLLLALEDMHNENCYFRHCKEGYIHMGMLDTLGAFSITQFSCDKTVANYPFLRTPYSWIGWDFPQLSKTVSKSFKKQLIHSIQMWPKRIQTFKRYISHPTTPKKLNRQEINGVCKRAKLLSQIIVENPNRTVKDWLYTILPEYAKVQKLTKRCFPKRDTSWILFRLQWSPQTTYNQISLKKQDRLRYLIENF
jgi:hypothetical protein